MPSHRKICSFLPMRRSIRQDIRKEIKNNKVNNINNKVNHKKLKNKKEMIPNKNIYRDGDISVLNG